MKKIALKFSFILLTVSFLICFVHTNDVLAQNGEGCTPGFWKQSQHFESWQINPDADFDTLFGVDSLGPDMTLLEVLRRGGGGMYALNRHAVAAFLNIISPDVSYLYTPGEVIQMVQEAYATGDFEAMKMILEYQNEMGCLFD
ncbi:MAG: hypothetical protein ACXACY_26980 [Candidatus Hodarchaeales archaeon]|jgi:hypothetical protein